MGSETNDPAPEPPPSRMPVAVYAGLLAAIAAVTYLLAWRTRLAVLVPLGHLAAWAALAAVRRLLPSGPFRLRGAVVGSLAVALVAGTARAFWSPGLAGAEAALPALQLAAITAFVLAFVLYFSIHYGGQLQRGQPQAGLATLLPWLRLLALAHALVGGALLLRLYTSKNPLPLTGDILMATAGVLAIEAGLRAAAGWFQPRRLRARTAPFGESVLLPALFGETGPWRSLSATFETSLGLKLGEAWLLRLARAWLAPLALLGLLGLMASTAVTRVPVDSRGVLIERGTFAEAALPPGLHFHAPWPWARVEVVATERIQEIALGFERDLEGPVLWAEKHFEGEQNLLVGQGEELLTVNAPVQYRIRDAVAYLRQTSDAPAALTALGYRQLLSLTGKYTSFGLMTTERQEIAEKLRTGLQADCDRLGLGLEIVFVGLKDVHPPVEVTPAYQEVVSAEEERLTIYDRAVADTVNILAEARSEATQQRLRADAFATERRYRAQSEAARFLAPLPLYRDYSDVYRTRVRLETMETVLAPVRSLMLLPASQRARAHLYLVPEDMSGFPLR